MLYKDLSRNEFQKVLEILDRSSVNYQIPEDDNIETHVNIKNRNLRHQHFHIIIEKEEFSKISPSDLLILERCGVMPEISEEFFESESLADLHRPVEKKTTGEKILTFISLVVFIGMALQWIYSHWKDFIS